MIKKIFVLMVLSVLTIFLCIQAKAESFNIKNSAAAILIEPFTKKILYNNNINKKLPIASTTKIMTALLSLEFGEIDQNFEVNKEAILVEGTSVGLQVGDIVSLRTLVYCMLLESGNDAANAAAYHIAGNVEEFSKLMNQRAQQIGMKNTNFVTPSGLDAQNHYSTAYDMALLASVALKNPEFSFICSQQDAMVEFGSPPVKRKLYNHNKLLQTYESAVGIKTGFTKKAGRCLVSAATKNGVTLICVTLDTADDWTVHKNLLNFGFSQISLAPLPKPENLTTSVTGSDETKVKLNVKGELTAPLTADDLKYLRYEIEMPFFLYAPIAEGEELGFVRYYVKDSLIRELPLICDKSIDKSIKKSGLLERMLRFITRIFL